jgi:hypothetical protein
MKEEIYKLLHLMSVEQEPQPVSCFAKMMRLRLHNTGNLTFYFPGFLAD